MSSFLHMIRTFFGVFLDALTLYSCVSSPQRSLQQKIYFCVNSSDFLWSEK
jgi:hypothetical protein